MKKNDLKRIEEVNTILVNILRKVDNRKNLPGYVFTPEVKVNEEGIQGIIYRIRMYDGDGYRKEVFRIRTRRNKLRVDIGEGEYEFTNTQSAINDATSYLIKYLNEESVQNEMPALFREQNEETKFINEAIWMAVNKLGEDENISKIEYNPYTFTTVKERKQFIGIDSNLTLVVDKLTNSAISFRRIFPKDKKSYKLTMENSKGKRSSIRSFRRRSGSEDTPDRQRELNEYAQSVYLELVNLVKSE